MLLSKSSVEAYQRPPVFCECVLWRGRDIGRDSGLMLHCSVTILCLQWVVFAPETFPFRYLGPYGTFCRYLVDNHSGILYKG